MKSFEHRQSVSLSSKKQM